MDAVASSTISVVNEKQDAALAALKGHVALQIAAKDALAQSSQLSQALVALGMLFEESGDAIHNIRYCGPLASDPSLTVFMTLGPFVEPEGRWTRRAGNKIYEGFLRGDQFLWTEEFTPEVLARIEQSKSPVERLFDSLKNGSGDLPSLIEGVLRAEGHLNARGDAEQTPLIVACRRASDSDWHRNAVATLIEHGADLMAVDDYGDCALTIAIYDENVDLIRDLLSRMTLSDDLARVSIEVAAQRASLVVLELLSDCGLPAIDSEALHLVCASPSPSERERLPLVRLLVEECCCDVDRPISDGLYIFGTPVLAPGATPLMAAAFAGETEVIEYLLSKGASASATDARGCSALHLISGPQWAIREGSLAWQVRPEAVEIARQLLEAGLSLDTPNQRGFSARALAEQYSLPLLEGLGQPVTW
ncbi:ankyrin repeat domain-containing protein [Pseudomonas sp. LABIM340]|uniref:ankyrin repeat domain-containing protein n=1 Tax=Pseudomonas sp. LABIM340 TaxID=3156585 RepID=UPI0032AE8A22